MIDLFSSIVSLGEKVKQKEVASYLSSSSSFALLWLAGSLVARVIYLVSLPNRSGRRVYKSV